MVFAGKNGSRWPRRQDLLNFHVRLPIIRWQWTLNSYQSPLGCFLKGKEEKKKSFKISASYSSACLTSKCEGCYEANKPFFWMVPFIAKSIFFQKVLLLNYIFCKGQNFCYVWILWGKSSAYSNKISLNLWIFLDSNIFLHYLLNGWFPQINDKSWYPKGAKIIVSCTSHIQ